ncbi:Prostaglandin E2 receptor EP3 subtype [Varanus komodoensis]|uniref:Prostaglandin E2 receptor EP3 subtype n=1 Tax=Varanus komodoensis TaxID=61221 RepID=A0A8D2IQS4_VARKO|nr:prostaglandin E2 receptor EP3 subtype [Varanus komodoensis]KAF7254546.1 Prostaglandin E2 receptor EP3 subtype [Varanus komodoensis]
MGVLRSPLAPVAATAPFAFPASSVTSLCRLKPTSAMALRSPGAAAKERCNATLPGEGECGSVSVVFPLTMMITGIVGNGLAMLLVYRAYHKKENQRKKSFLLCIGSLALTDLSGQLLTSPIVIAVYLANRNWRAVDPSLHLCTFFGLSMTVFGLCPLFIASAMAIERALAIRAPHWYTGHMKTRLTKSVLLSVWLAVFAFALLPILGIGKYTLQWPGTWCFISTKDQEGPRVGNVIFASTFAFLGLFSLTITMVCNISTIVALVCRCQSRRQWGRITMETLIQLLGIMCVLFACWSPLLIMMLKVTFNHTSVDQCKEPCNQTQCTELQPECNFFLTAIRLASLNQILDPWVYLLLRKILLQKFCQAANAISCHSQDGWKERHFMLSDKIRHTAA